MNVIAAVFRATRGACLHAAFTRLSYSSAPLRAAFLLLALCAPWLFTPQCVAGAVGTFSPVGSLTTIRSSNTATLLPNGKVLVAGGVSTSSFDASNSAELYDPATAAWTVTGNLVNARESHTSTLLQNGKVLVAGGVNTNTVLAAELYDPATGTWATTGTLNQGRLEHTATLLQNGKVLVAGGNSGDLFTTELYDPTTGTWTNTGPLMDARIYHTATLLPNGKVLVVGGASYSKAASLSSAELYDPSTGHWSYTGSLNTAREYHAATLLANGKVLVVGGIISVNHSSATVLSSAELYDPATGVWTVTGELAGKRSYHTATLLEDGTVLVSGGDDSPFFDDSLSSSELYNPATGAWTITGSLSAPREEHTATLLANGNVLMAGGVSYTSSVNYLSSAEVYEAPYVDAPAKPVNFRGKLKLHHVLLSWVQPDTYATGFVIQRRTKKTAGGYTPWKTQFTLLLGVTQATDKTVKKGTVYEYQIEALNKTVPSAFSAIAKVTVR